MCLKFDVNTLSQICLYELVWELLRLIVRSPCHNLFINPVILP